VAVSSIENIRDFIQAPSLWVIAINPLCPESAIRRDKFDIAGHNLGATVGDRKVDESLMFPRQSGLVDDRDLLIIRSLVLRGSTAGVASAVGLSERHTRRLIGELLRRIDFENTHALVAWAASKQLISPFDLPDVQ
jgi:hypothetical protein